MTYKEFQIALIKLNLNIKDFALILGMHPNSITNYKLKGFIPLQLCIIVNLMVELNKNHIDYKDIIDKSKKEFSNDYLKNNW